MLFECLWVQYETISLEKSIFVLYLLSAKTIQLPYLTDFLYYYDLVELVLISGTLSFAQVKY